MIDIYCRSHHGKTGVLCDGCSELAAYARRRLEKCPYGDEKPTCTKCPIHCYRPEMRQKTQEVMAFSGSRMTTRHPILALLHLIDGLREPPPHPKTGKCRITSSPATEEL